jgi:hypothetical protein
MPMMTARIYPSTGGFGWLLFQDAACVGSSENPSKSPDNAVAAVKRWAKKYGYGEIVSFTLPPGAAHGLQPDTVGDIIIRQH